MEQKINIAELLEDCPKDMELDCTIYDGVNFMEVDTESDTIILRVGNKFIRRLNKYGQEDDVDCAKCVIFPKGKTTWEGFQRPFKNGDILISRLEGCEGNPFIFKQINGFGNAECYCAINCYGELIFNSDNWTSIKGCRLATTKEKEKLFDAIKSHGYKWNEETKTLETLPKFKVGDRIKHKANTIWVCTIERVTDRYYVHGHPTCYTLLFDNQDEYELVSNKFDVTTLQPFDKVLIRDTVKEIWKPDFFGCLYDSNDCPYMVVGGIRWKYCIPYKGNEYLLGTVNDCNEYFKNWE